RMRKIYLFLGLFLWTLGSWAQVTLNPYPFSVDQQITITVDTGSNATDCNGLGGALEVYLHSGIGTDANPWGHAVVGNWGQDDGIGEMTDNGDGTWSISFVPKDYYGLDDAQADTATKMGMVFRNASGGELKDNGCEDFIFEVGQFQLQLDSPIAQLSRLAPGESLTIGATSSLAADFSLSINGTIVDTALGTMTYSFTHAN